MADWLPVLAQAVRDRPAGEPPLVAVREALLALATPELRDRALLWGGIRPTDSTTVSRPSLPVLRLAETAVAQALTARLTGDPAVDDVDLHAQVLARAASGAVRTCLALAATRPETHLDNLLRASFGVLIGTPSSAGPV